MDWNKAKKGMIFLFVFINLILATIIVFTITEDAIDKATIENVLIALKQRNIRIKADIPTRVPNLNTFKLLEENLKKDINFFLDEDMLKNKYKNIEILEQNKRISPAHNVLLKNFVKSDQLRVIKDIEIGYMKKHMRLQDVHVIFVPVWRVKLQEGEEFYFNAFSGALIDD